MKIVSVHKKRDIFDNIYSSHNRALIELARKDNRIISCYADFPSAEVGEIFIKEFPDRIIDVGIAEGHMITCSAGLADAGFIPFTHCHALFGLGRGYNQIRQNIAYDNRNVKIVLCNSGVIWGGIGPSHLAIEDLAALRAIPNLVIISPSDPISAEKATFAAAEYIGPVILRLPFIGEKYPILYKNNFKFEIGKAICVHDGDEVTILATGILVNDALLVSEEFEKKGIGVKVIDIQTIKPLDEDAILSAAKETNAIVTVEDANIYGGLGGAVAELLSEKYPTIVKKVGVKDQFGESGKSNEIKEYFKLTPSFIKEVVTEAIKIKKQNLFNATF
jgi:transketolase